VLAAGTLAVYVNALSNPFVFDDTDSVTGNLIIRSLTLDALRAPRQTAIAGRPLVNLSFALNYAWGGMSPWGYHAWNLGVHLLCGLLFFGIVRRTLAQRALDFSWPPAESRPPSDGVPVSDWVAFACALVWLLHPVQTEVIDYVTQRTESMMGFFYFLTLYGAIRAMTGPRTARWTSVAIVACALGMFTKESMATAPLMVFLYDVVFVAGGFGRALRQRRALHAGLAATWAIVIALVLSGPRFRSAGFSSGVSPWTYLLNQTEMIVRYLTVAVWPRGLVLDYGVPRALNLADVLPAAVFIVALLAVALALWRRHRALAFLAAWFFVTLAPTSSIVPVATEAGAERRMYLPLAAIVVLAVAAVARMLGALVHDPRRRLQMSAAALAAATAILGLLTVRRNAEYATNTRVWQTSLERFPQPRAHYNLGVALKDEGRRKEALEEYQRAADGGMSDAFYALGFELDADGRYKESVERLREYIRRDPDNANVVRAYNLLGRGLMTLGELSEAEHAYRQVLRMQPRNVDGWGGLADVLIRRQNYDEAIVTYQEYARLSPRMPGAYVELGLALTQKDRFAEAAEAFAAAVALDPNDAATRLTLAHALLATGRPNEAATHYRTALALKPTDSELRREVETVLRRIEEQAKQ